MAGKGGDKAPVLDRDALEAARAFGYDGDAEVEDDELKIWPENWEAVLMALNMITQVSFSMSGKLTGFNYTSLPIVEKQLGFDPDADRFERFRIIENEMRKSV